VIVILDSSNRQIGSGTTDFNGNFLVRWTSSNNVTSGKVRWFAEHSGNRFKVKTGTGGRHTFTSGTRTLNNGRTQTNPNSWGDIRWGSSTTPHPVSNVYDGAHRTWFYSAQYSPRAIPNFVNVELRAFNTNCPTSCANALRVDLDTGADTPYVYSARTAHELGHIVSDQVSQGREAASCNDYSRNGAGWSITSPEHMCAGYEEAYATLVGDIGRHWFNAPQPFACGYETGVCSLNTETSSAAGGGSCDGSVEEERWVLTTLRFLWDVYDDVNDGGSESVRQTYDRVIDNQGNFAIGTANHQRDEPFAGGTLSDQDGKGQFDYLVNFETAHPVELDEADAINCFPPGD